SRAECGAKCVTKCGTGLTNATRTYSRAEQEKEPRHRIAGTGPVRKSVAYSFVFDSADRPARDYGVSGSGLISLIYWHKSERRFQPLFDTPRMGRSRVCVPRP